MNNMAQYTEVRTVAGDPDLHTVYLKSGGQEFTLAPSYSDRDSAEWMREMLCVALARIVKERRGDPTW